VQDPTINDFPKQISRFFKFGEKVYPRGGVIKYGKKVVILGSTSTHIIALGQSFDNLKVIEIPSLKYIPEPPSIHIQTVDELLNYAYKVIFTPYYAEIVKANKTIMAGIIFSSNINKNRQIYWVYDPDTGTKNKVELIKAENTFIRYVEMQPDDLNQILSRLFNPNGIKEVLRQYLDRGLFILDNYGE